MRCLVTELAHESVEPCRCSWFVGEPDSSYERVSLVKRILKICDAHNLDVEMLDFAARFRGL